MNRNPIFFAFTSLCITTLSSVAGMAQEAPVSWSCQWNNRSGNEGTLVIAASLDPGWHMYSQDMEEGGPIRTQLEFFANDEFELVGKPEERGTVYSYYDSIYEMTVKSYAYEVGFLQKVKLKTSRTKIKCKITYMICDDEQCIASSETLTIPAVMHRPQ